MKYCPNCGAKVSEKASFCPQCGFNFNKSVSSENTDNPKKAAKAIHKSKAKHHFNKKSKLLLGLVAVIAVAIIYLGIYIPHEINSSLQNNGFTQSKGYKININRSKKLIVLRASTANETTFNQQLRNNEFDTESLPVEGKMANVAHDLAGHLPGTWTIEMRTQDNPNNQKLGNYWVFQGTKETKHFQTSSAGREARAEYLELKRKQAENAEKNEEDNEMTSAIGGGLLGGAIGYMLGGD